MAAGAHAREADQAFHVLIANVAGNSVLADLVARLWHGMFSPMFHKLSEHTGHMANQGTDTGGTQGDLRCLVDA